MKTITLKVPDMSEFDSKQLYMILASGLYEQGKLSLGQVAELAKFNYQATDLEQDVANANKYVG